MNFQVVGISGDTSLGGLPPVVVALAVGLALIVLLPAWLLLARSRFLSGDTDVAPTVNRIPQLYGYSVCLIALITALVSLSSLIDNAFRLSNPLRADERWGPFGASLDSFEAYKATHRRGDPIFAAVDRATPAESLSDEELRRRYEALRADRIADTRFQAQRRLTTNGVTLLISLGLFGVHWWWLKRRVEARDRSQ